MSVAQSVSRSISRSRNTARHATPDAIRSYQPSHPVADSINTIEVAAPSTVSVGETFTGTVTVEIGAASSGPLLNRPDNCASDTRFGLTGFNTLVGIGFQGVSGAVDLTSGCLDAPNAADAALGQTEVSNVPYQLTAPEDPGNYQLQVSLTGDDSGMIMDETFVSIEVVGDEPEPPEPPEPPDPPGNGNGNGSGGIFGRLIDLLRSVLSVVETGFDSLARIVETGFDTLGTIIEENAGLLSDVIEEIADLLRRAGGTLRDIVFRAFGFVRDNPLLLAVLILAVFGVAPALGDTLIAFTPVGIAREIIPFIG